MSDDVPKYPGPRLVPLLDGSLAFSDSEAYRHELEAREIAAKPKYERDGWLADIEAIRGPAEAARLRKTIDEVIAVTAARAR